MSIELMSKVFNYPMPELKSDSGETVSASTATFVLLALADHANDEGENIYPSLKRLVQKTKFSEPTVIKALNALGNNGLIRKWGISRKGTSEYTINVAALDHPPQSQFSETKATLGEGLKSLLQTPKATLVEPSINPQIKPSTERVPRTAEEIKQGIARALKEGIEKHNERLALGQFEAEGYPEDIKPTVELVAELWKLRIPERIHLSRSQYSYWIKGARALNDACGEFGVELLREVYADFEKNNPELSISSPQSLVKLAESAAARKRRELEKEGPAKVPPPVMWDSSLSEEENLQRSEAGLGIRIRRSEGKLK